MTSWAYVAVAIFAAVTVFACLGEVWWIFDLFAHFRVQYLLIAAALAAVVCGLRRRNLFAAVLLLAAPHAWQVAPMVDLSALRPAEAAGAASLRIATFNAQWRNQRRDSVVNWVRASEPDVLLLQEVGPAWQSQFDQLAAMFPHHVPADRGDGTALHLFSRHPVDNVRIDAPVGLRFPVLTVEIDVEGSATHVAAVHAPAPTSAWLSNQRNAYLDAVAEWARQFDGPVIAFGDFNVSPWSGHFQDVTESADLRDAAEGQGWQPTWPAWSPVAGVPIDHILTSRHLSVSAFTTGPDLGSDHLPLIADLTVKR